MTTSILDLNRLFYFAEDFMRHMGRTEVLSQPTLFIGTTGKDTFDVATFPVPSNLIDPADMVADVVRLITHTYHADRAVLVCEGLFGGIFTNGHIPPEIQAVLDGRASAQDLPERFRQPIILMHGEGDGRREVRAWFARSQPDKTRTFVPIEPIWDSQISPQWPMLLDCSGENRHSVHREITLTAIQLSELDIQISLYPDRPNVDAEHARSQRSKLKELIDGW